MPDMSDVTIYRKENLFKSIINDKFARCAFIVLLFMYLTVFLPSFISPYSKDYSNRSKSYCPPSKIYIIDENGKLSFPYTYNYIRHFDKEDFSTKYIEDRKQKGHGLDFTENSFVVDKNLNNEDFWNFWLGDMEPDIFYFSFYYIYLIFSTISFYLHPFYIIPILVNNILFNYIYLIITFH